MEIEASAAFAIAIGESKVLLKTSVEGSWGPAVQRAASVMPASRTESLAFSPTTSTLDFAIDELEEIGSSSGA